MPAVFLRLLLSLLCYGAFTLVVCAGQVELSCPPGSGQFGSNVVVLPNGNFVVTDPRYSIPDGPNWVGAAYLYDGKTLNQISALTGSTAGDMVSDGGITVLSNGSYVVRNLKWKNGIPSATWGVGAVTWCNAATGVNGTVTANNSLVGAVDADRVGGEGVTPLANGNYVVCSANWRNSLGRNVGAVTWGNGDIGTTGMVSVVNSLIGGTFNDHVGSDGVTALNNGNYVVRSLEWDNGATTDAGAVTWGNGATGTTGIVSAANSLIGSAAYDTVGSTGITPLNNGNYVVCSRYWDNGSVTDAGAATWGNGMIGVGGTISAANSLVGSNAFDQVGYPGAAGLFNGNYVVVSQVWKTPATVGAVTWGNGTNGITGWINPNNSLVGSSSQDNIGSGGLIVLNNGNYVVLSPDWKNASTPKAGAITWANGVTGGTGVVSTANSLVGTSPNDAIGRDGRQPLTNGNYVVVSGAWDNGLAIDAGAVTWGNGVTSTTGTVSVANSLVGTSANDRVGITGVTPLANGNYVLISSGWDFSGVTDVGAVTWGNGISGSTGPVSPANSLIGTSPSDMVGLFGVVALGNGNYVVASPRWDNGTITNAGAVTWGNGTNGTFGFIAATNSLIGNASESFIGSGLVTALANENYVVSSPRWNGALGVTNRGALTLGNGGAGTVGAITSANSLLGNSAFDGIGSAFSVTVFSDGAYVEHNTTWDKGDVINAGAVSLGNRARPARGIVSTANSVLGSTTNGGIAMTFAYDINIARLIVGDPAGNRVTLLSYDEPVLDAVGCTDGIFRVQVFGPRGSNYVMLSSTNLINWSPLATNAAATTPFLFDDSTAASNKHMFYRVRLQP